MAFSNATEFLDNNIQVAPNNDSSTATAFPIPCELPETSAVFPTSDKFMLKV
jgi:hypothetical protein